MARSGIGLNLNGFLLSVLPSFCKKPGIHLHSAVCCANMGMHASHAARPNLSQRSAWPDPLVVYQSEAALGMCTVWTTEASIQVCIERINCVEYVTTYLELRKRFTTRSSLISIPLSSSSSPLHALSHHLFTNFFFFENFFQ